MTARDCPMLACLLKPGGAVTAHQLPLESFPIRLVLYDDQKASWKQVYDQQMSCDQKDRALTAAALRAAVTMCCRHHVLLSPRAAVTTCYCHHVLLSPWGLPSSL